MKQFILIFLSIPFFIQSQENDNRFNLLVMAGVSPAQIHGDSYSGFNKLGGIGGIGIETQFNQKTSLNVAFQFIQKGARKNQNPQKNDYAFYYLNLNYLEVPINLAYTQKKIIVDFGVSAAYLIDYYEGSDVGNLTGLYPFNKFDYSVKVGLGYNINPKWFVNVRSSNSFMTIRPNRVKQAIYYNNIIARTFNKGYYNNILEITLGYRIKPKKSKSESK